MKVGFFLKALVTVAGVLGLAFAQGQAVPKIVGGRDAKAGDFPWMVSLLRGGTDDNFQGQFCGGVLIHPYWVVTAAHCFAEQSVDEIELGIGSIDLRQQRRLKVAEIILHPVFTPVGFGSDIALLRLREPVLDVEPLQLLVDAARTMAGVEATAMGWGALSGETNPGFSPILQVVEIPLVDNATVNQSVFEGQLGPEMLVAGRPQGGVDTCGGDSGGPLLVRSADDSRWLLAGVTSFGLAGKACGEAGAYGVYTRVTSFRDWVEQHIRPNYAAFEESSGANGYFIDQDGDGRPNYQEFVEATNPAMADSAPAVRLMRQGADGGLILRTLGQDSAGEVEDRWEFSQNLTDWSLLVGSPTDVDGTMLAGTGERRFFRRVIEPGVRESSEVTFLTAPAGRELLIESDGKREIALRFEAGAPDGGSWEVIARADETDVRLRVLDEQGNVVASSDQNTAGGGDERVTFSRQAGQQSYRAEVLGEAGKAVLISVREVQTAPAAVTLGSVDGRLQNGDDAIGEGGQRRFRDVYRLVPEAFVRRISVRVTSDANDSGFDSVVQLFNAETGRLLEFNDDEVTGDATSSALAVTLQPRQEYDVVVTSFEAGATGRYQLVVSAPEVLAGPVDVMRVLRTGDVVVGGFLVDDYVFAAPEGGKSYTVLVESGAFDEVVFVSDAVMSLVDADDRRAGFQFRATAAGQGFLISVSSERAGRNGEYRLVLRVD